MRLALYEGSWLTAPCAPYQMTGSSKAYDVVTFEGPSSVRYERGHLVYDNTRCEGEGTELREKLTDLGTVEFWSEESGGGLTFHRGTWSMPTGDVFQQVWALRADGSLCTHIDVEPTLFVDASDVMRFLDSPGPAGCATRMAE